jgi:hypothetical protein
VKAGVSDGLDITFYISFLWGHMLLINTLAKLIPIVLLRLTCYFQQEKGRIPIKCKTHNPDKENKTSTI